MNQSRFLLTTTVAFVALVLAGCSSTDLTQDQTTTALTSAVTQPEASNASPDTTANEQTGNSSETTEQTAPEETTACLFAVAFDEGAPRDRVTLGNVGPEDVAINELTIDLSSSAGQLIFDTREGGDGVEVFQDFQTESGTAVLATDPAPQDGDDTLTLVFESFAPGDSFTFSLDVDDQLANSDLGQIQVTGAEIEGAEVRATLSNDSNVTAVFDATSNALGPVGCAASD